MVRGQKSQLSVEEIEIHIGIRMGIIGILFTIISSHRYNDLLELWFISYCV